MWNVWKNYCRAATISHFHHCVICLLYSRLTVYALKWQKPTVTSSCCFFDRVFSWTTELLQISQRHSSPVELCKDTPTQFTTLRLPSSWLELKKPLGWEVKRLLETETGPVAYDTSTHRTFLNQRIKVRRSWILASSLKWIIKTEIIKVQLLVKDLFSLSVGGKFVLNYSRRKHGEWNAPLNGANMEQFAWAEAETSSLGCFASASAGRKVLTFIQRGSFGSFFTLCLHPVQIAENIKAQAFILAQKNQYSSTHQDTTDAILLAVKNKSELCVLHVASGFSTSDTRLFVSSLVQTLESTPVISHASDPDT